MSKHPMSEEMCGRANRIALSSSRQVQRSDLIRWAAELDRMYAVCVAAKDNGVAYYQHRLRETLTAWQSAQPVASAQPVRREGEE
jgi:hypothetical protein